MSEDTNAPTRARARRRAVLVVTLSIALAGLVGPGAAMAEIYKWRDESGRLHFAQDLNQVPQRHRAQARSGKLDDGGRSPIQRYESAPAAPARSLGATTSSGKAKGGGGRVHRIRVEKVGSTMKVNVRLNGVVTAPFYVDTGASDVVLPEWVAKELGLDLSDARTAFYGTANGTIQQSLVTLGSVELGTAKATQVPASVSKTMSTGLLGLSFFNHFRYRFDPAAGLIHLQDNGLAESGQIRGGRSASQWRRQFAGLAARRKAIEAELERTNSNRSRQRAELQAMIDEVDRQYAVLEDEADEARVPMQWRD